MIKKMLVRGIKSFSCAVTINVLIYVMLIVSRGAGDWLPMLPEFQAGYDSPVLAILVQCLLVALCSAVFGAGSVLFEMERMGLMAQSIIYFVITSAVWVPVACYCWGMHKYPMSVLGVGASYVVSYVICWGIGYHNCRKSVEQINRKLRERQWRERYDGKQECN